MIILKKLLAIFTSVFCLTLVGLSVGSAQAMPPLPPMGSGPDAPELPENPPVPDLPPCVECDEFLNENPTPTTAPTGEQVNPTPTTPATGETPHPQPCNGCGEGGNGGGGTGGSTTGQVLGLSATSGEGIWETLVTLTGVLGIAGGFLVSRNRLAK